MDQLPKYKILSVGWKGWFTTDIHHLSWTGNKLWIPNTELGHYVQGLVLMEGLDINLCPYESSNCWDESQYGKLVLIDPKAKVTHTMHFLQVYFD